MDWKLRLLGKPVPERESNFPDDAEYNAIILDKPSDPSTRSLSTINIGNYIDEKLNRRESGDYWIVNKDGISDDSVGDGYYIGGDSGNLLSGYYRVSDTDSSNLEVKAPDGFELTLDINADILWKANSAFTLLAELSVSPGAKVDITKKLTVIDEDVILNQSLSTTDDVIFNRVDAGKFYGRVPLGAVIPIVGTFTGANNSGTSNNPNSIPTSGYITDDGFQLCDGVEVGTGSILLGYVPNITDSRFIMGSSSLGTIGGNTNNLKTLSKSEIPSHNHGLSGNITLSGETSPAQIGRAHV